MKTKPGDQFSISVADGYVLMEAVRIRCGDVWDCVPASVTERGKYEQTYGKPMVFTDDEVAEKVAWHRKYMS